MKVKKTSELLTFLLENYELTNKKIKNNLKNGFIFVNNNKIKQYNYLLKPNDIVSINKENSVKNNLSIIYEDSDIIVVNKPYGLLTIATIKEKEKTLYKEVSDYIKKKNKNNNIFIIHRLDQDTSGVIMFAKNEKIKNMYQDNWNDLVKKREYIAIVSGILDKKEDTIVTYLNENKAGNVYATTKNDGKEAITKYRVLKENSKYSMLEVSILTGRKNQIRVHLSDINHPVLGDRKYNGEISPIKRLCLHANKLEIINPITKKLDKYEVRIPNNFMSVIRGDKNDK